MMGFYAIVGFLLFLGGTLGGVFYLSQRLGETEEKNKSLSRQNKQVKDSANAQANAFPDAKSANGWLRSKRK